MLIQTELWVRHKDQAFSNCGRVVDAEKLLAQSAATDRFFETSTDLEILEELGEPTNLGGCFWQSFCDCCTGSDTEDSRASTIAVYTWQQLA
jgi:hypothetical protein